MGSSTNIEVSDGRADAVEREVVANALAVPPDPPGNLESSPPNDREIRYSNPTVNPSTVTLLRLVILSVSLVLLIASRLLEQPRRTDSRWVDGAFVFLALVSICGYFNFGQFRDEGGFVNRWEHFHFFLGSKYLPEVRYDGLYVATLTAVNDRWPGAITDSEVRDLMTFDMNTAVLYFDQAEPIKERFGPERWAEFARDVDFFALEFQLNMARILQDHGNTGSPAWGMLARAFTAPFPAGWKILNALSFLDFLLLLGMFAAFWRAFGIRAASVAVIVAMLTPRGYLFLGGSIFRLDWLVALGFALSFLKLRRFKTAGVFLAWAIASKPFCALFALALGARFIWVALRNHRVRPDHIRLVASSLVALIAIVVFSSLSLGGFHIWSDYAHRITANLTEGHYHDNHSFTDVYLQFVQSGVSTLWELAPDTHAAGLYEFQKERTTVAFAVARLALLALLVCVMTRHEDDGFAFSLGAFWVFVVFATNTYYWQMLCLPAVVFAHRYRKDWRQFLYLAAILLFLIGSYAFIQLSPQRHLQGYFGSIRLFFLCLLMGAVELAQFIRSRLPRPAPAT